MWSLLTAFTSHFVTWMFRAVIIKFLMVTAIIALLAVLAIFVFNYIVNVDLFGLRNLMEGMPDGLLFFLHVFQVHIGIPLMLAALGARFAIRRIPFIG